MPGVKALRKLQLGAEGTAGTATAATTIWRGEGMGADTTVVEFPPEDVGILGGTDRAYIPAVGAEITLDDTPVTYEQIGYILNAGVQSATATTDSSAYYYTHNFSTTAQNTIKTYTIEFGDDQQEEEAEYCFVKEFGIKGEAGGALMVNATWEGRQVTASTFTGALSIPTVEEVLFSKGVLYIDPVSTYPATTQKSNTLVSMDLAVTTGISSYKTASGVLYFSGHKITVPEVVLQLKFEHDSTAVAEKAAWRAGTARSVRLKWTGSSISGSTYTTKTFIIDLVGKYEKVDAIEDADGNDQINFTMRCRYNGTAGALGKFIVANSLATMP